VIEARAREERAVPGQDRTRNKVIYIGGWGRSGSTLVDRVLGQIPGIVSVGEVREVWQRGWVENRPCGCGKPFADCPFWRAVGEFAFGGWEALDREVVLGLRYSLDRGWSVPLLAAPQGLHVRAGRVARYAAILERLYAGIREVSGAATIVDSSKLPSHALILRRVPGVDLSLVHLVRDSRGVAYSWQKHVRNRVTAGETKYLAKYDPFSASLRYDLYNELTRLVGRLGVPYLLVRYEDFVTRPRESLERILAHAGVHAGQQDLSFVGDGEVTLAPNHTADGNPMRFSVGPVGLRLDDEWTRGMSSRDRLWVTALTSPLLRSYGYKGKARAAREGSMTSPGVRLLRTAQPSERAQVDTGAEPVRVLYIGGLGRSGSTLVDRMLGQIPGFFSAGEIRDLWQRGLKENRLCGCGEPFFDCPVWSRVGDEAFGGWANVDADEVQALARSVDRHALLPLLMNPRLWPPFARQVERYAGLLGPLFQSLRRVTGARTVIDSSKAPSTAFLLRQCPGVELSAIHLVRDSRGVAYSWTKKIARPDTPGRVVFMHRYQPARIALRWVTRNAMMEMLGHAGVREVRVRYETLVQEPREEMTRVLKGLGEPFTPGDLAFIADGHVTLSTNHTVMGNPMRMDRGPIPLRLDDQWRSSMGRRPREMVTILTEPFLRRYGYRR
jgi:Sulfotransferase family